jgi:hypothetical protein
LLEPRDAPLEPVHRNRVRRIHKNALFMHGLIGDLLDVVRLEAGRMRLSRT